MIQPLPDIMKGDFDKDSLVYINDDEFYYAKEFPTDILDDINNKDMQIYTGYYISPIKGLKESPRIYLIGRGKKSGKFKFKVQGFYPYCLSSDTDILTEDGWINIKDIVDGKLKIKIATLNSNTNKVEYHYPDGYTYYYYN